MVLIVEDKVFDSTDAQAALITPDQNPNPSIQELNNHFRNGGHTSELYSDLWKIFDKPILALDIDGTVINNEMINGDYYVMQGAQEFCRDISEYYQIIFVTNAIGWESKKAELEKYGLWNNQDILICLENHHNHDLKGDLSIFDKDLSYIFPGVTDIILIDDSEHVLNANPNITSFNPTNTSFDIIKHDLLTILNV